MDEELFRQAISCLKRAGINSWVERGTLLGLVRDGKVIPWDHDFDFGVWDHEVTEEMVFEAFDDEAFLVEALKPRGIDGVHVCPRDEEAEGRIDIVFYTRQDGRAVHHANCIIERPWTDPVLRLERFLDPDTQAEEKYKHAIEMLFHKGLVPLLPNKAKMFLRTRVRDSLAGLHLRASLRYDFPAHHFENLRPVSFLGVQVNIPGNAEGYLELAYGKDWERPKKWKHWYEGATHISVQRKSGATYQRVERLRARGRA